MTLDTVKNYIGYAIGFIVLILILAMIGGEKMANTFLVLILIGAVVFNSNEMIKALSNLF